MNAWQIATHGGNEVLKRIELEVPKPGPLEVRVDVRAVGLNHLDLWVRKGVPGHQFPLPLIPGTDSVGVISALGEGSDATHSGKLKIGARVIVAPGISCGKCPACLSDNDPLCAKFGILGETVNGGCADSIVVPARNIILIPESMNFETAAAIGIPYLTAWSMLVRKARVAPGEWVLIQAGGSSVSIAATQIAKLHGAHVITTVGDDAKIAKSKAAGADHVINYKTSAFRDELRKILKLLGKRGVDIAIDHVGKDTFVDSMKSLAWGGRLATCGATTGGDVTIDLKLLFFKNLSLLGTTMGARADLVRVVELVTEGKLKPVIDRKLPMDKLGEALSLIESRTLFGKVLVTQGA
jgi:NADPH:quinone reductase-like Zn-dependent oxidoreductase